MLKMSYKPFAVIITGPSGSGKTTICRKLLEKCNDLEYSVSVTTRKRRPQEQNGKDYIFVDENTFKKWVEEGKFLEWQPVYGDYYGTLRETVEKILEKGKNVLMDLDLKGTKNVKRMRPDSVTIFIMPPSIEELKNRLKKRGDEKEVIEKRLKESEKEIKQFKDFDYVVLNEEIEETVENILKIIEAEKLKSVRYDEG